MLFNHKNNLSSENTIRTSVPTILTSSTDFFGRFSGSFENDDDDDDDDFDDDDDDDDDMYSTILGHYFSLNRFNVEESNAVSRVIKKEAYCFDVKKFAERLVEATYVEANKALSQDEKVVAPVYFPCFETRGETAYFANYDEAIEESPSDNTFNDLSTTSSSYWPKISEFNIKLGLEKIEYYVSQWKRSDDWKFCVEFLGFECEDCSNIFVFEVEWSKPTISYPIPQATASIYFAMEVYKMVPPQADRSIEVTYIFECSNVIHNPGKINFQEKWLEQIIEAKLKFFKTITFSVPRGLCDKTDPVIPQNLY